MRANLIFAYFHTPPEKLAAIRLQYSSLRLPASVLWMSASQYQL